MSNLSETAVNGNLKHLGCIQLELTEGINTSAVDSKKMGG